MNRMQDMLRAVASRLAPAASAHPAAPRPARPVGIRYGASQGDMRQRRDAGTSMPARFRFA